MPTYEIITDKPLSDVELMLIANADENDKAMFLLFARRVRELHTHRIPKIKELERLSMREYQDLIMALAIAIREILLPEYHRTKFLKQYKLEPGRKVS